MRAKNFKKLLALAGCIFSLAIKSQYAGQLEVVGVADAAAPQAECMA